MPCGNLAERQVRIYGRTEALLFRMSVDVYKAYSLHVKTMVVVLPYNY